MNDKLVNMETIASLKKTAKLSGLLYILMVATGFFGLIYVPLKLMVKDNPVATSAKILQHEFLFRAAIVSNLFSGVISIFLAILLYKLFRRINDRQAKLLVIFTILPVAIDFVLEALRITALLTLKGEILQSLSPQQQQDMTMLLLQIYGNGTMTWELFMGLWLLPFGLLVYKSHFIPRILGVFLIAACAGYIIDSITFILFPDYRNFTKITAWILSGIGESSIILWLLIIGIRDHLSITVVSEKEVLRPEIDVTREQLQ